MTIQSDAPNTGFPNSIEVGRVRRPTLPDGDPPEDVEPATVPFDDDSSILSSRTFVTGISGSGKSNTVNVLAEEILRAGRPLAILDADGEYYGLREEFEVLLLGEDECDLRAGAEHGEKLAELALEQRVPLIFDMSSYLDPDEAEEAAQAFLQALFSKAKTLKEPFPVFVEEAHEFVPQQGSVSELGEMLFRLAKRGRKHGIGVTAVSQRPAEVAKTFITQAEAVVWHRLTWKNDTGVAGDDLGAAFEDPITNLDDGEAFVRAEWEDGVKRVQFRRQDTYDGGQTPTLDANATPELKSVDEDVVGQLEDITERQGTLEDENERLRAERDHLQDRVEALESELETRNAAQEEFADSAQAFAGAVEDALTELSQPAQTVGEDDGVRLEMPDHLRTEVMEVVREEAADRVATLEAAVEDRDAALARKDDRVEELETVVDKKTAHIEELEATIDELNQRVDELEPIKERVEELREAHARMGEALGEPVGAGQEYRQRAQQEVEQREAAIEEYQALLRGDLTPDEAEVPVPDAVTDVGAGDGATEPADEADTDGPQTASNEAESIVDRLDHEEVQRRVSRASEETRPKTKHLWDLLFVLAEIADGDHPQFSDEAGERPTPEDLLPELDVAAESSVYALLQALGDQGAGLIEKHDRGHKQKATYSFDASALDRLDDANERRERREQFREMVNTDSRA